MKRLFLIGGTMGVGKTTVGQILKKRLPDCVFLDGDWCWEMDPFQVNDETKQMVMENICFLLKNFIRCSAYKNIVFCWVMHEQTIIDEILGKLPLEDCQVFPISLLCAPAELERRLQKDVADGIRREDVIGRSTERLPLYRALHTLPVDVTELTPEETAAQIERLCGAEESGRAGCRQRRPEPSAAATERER